jgi:two-component system, sensor histidine kinase and response regulator
LAELFPFYLSFDRDLRILNSGKSLRKACPDALPGTSLPEIFSVERPRIPLSPEALDAAGDSLFLLKHRSSTFWIRGQLLSLPGASYLLLGSPWVHGADTLRAWNLSLADFAIHDSTPELVQASASQKLALDDLRRVADKLDGQRTQLRQALDTIQEGEQQRRLLSLIVARSTNAVVVTDPKGRIEWINDSFSRLTGYARDELFGRYPGELLQGPRTDMRTVLEMRAAIDAGHGFTCELANYRKDGRLFWNRMEVQPIRSDEGSLSNFVGVLVDVTAEREASAQKELALQITRILAETTHSRKATRQILQVICTAVGAAYGGLWWTDPTRESLRLSQFWASDALRDSSFLTKSKTLAFHAGQGLPGRVWEQNTVIPIPRVEDSVEWSRKQEALEAGLRSGLAFPVRTAGITVGVIEIFADDDDALPAFLPPVAESFGVQIGQFIQRRRAETQRDSFLSLLQSALDSAPEGVVVSDLQGRAVRFNDRWRQLVGMEDAQEPERWSEPLIRQFKRTEEQFAVWVRLESHFDESLAAKFQLLDGRTIEAVTNPHRNGGVTIGQIWLFRDVTQSLAEMQERDRLVAMLNATLESTNDGILVTGFHLERIVSNQRFLEMWRIPRAVAEADPAESMVPFVLDQLCYPHAFEERIQSLFRDTTATATAVFELTEGRIFELYTQPQRIGDRIIGRIWCYRDISSQWAANRALRDSEQRYRFIADTAPVAIVTFDAAGRIRFANSNANARFDGPGRDLVGSNVATWFPETLKRRYLRLLRRFIASSSHPANLSVELSLLDTESRLLPVEVSLGASSQGEDLLVTAVIRDISQRKAIEDQVRQTARAAAAASRAKTDFLANISHEIRTPLNAIVGLTELLRGSSLPRDTRETVDSIWVSAESLLALINDLIDISKIEAGQIDLEFQDFDPAELAERAVDVARIRAAAKSLKLYLYVEPSSPPVLRGDPNRIRQVLVNLLSNAVKFTESGSVTLILRWRSTDGGVVLEFTVADTGIGIAPAEQERIFENFYRTESPLTAQSGGAGLGLGISRSIARKLGGTLSVRSRPGEGSLFTLSLPSMYRSGPTPTPPAPKGDILVATTPPRMETHLAVVRSAGYNPVPCAGRTAWPSEYERFSVILLDEEFVDLGDWEPPPHPSILWLRMTTRAANPAHRPVLSSPLTPARLQKAIHAMTAAPEAPRLPAAPPPPERRRVLLVEDNPAGQLYLRKLLAANSYEVAVADSATDASAMLRSMPFDVILMDIQLPDGSGVDVIREFRAFERASGRPRIPVVALSAHALAGVQSTALDAGADDYITKPVRPGTLLDSLRRWLASRLRVVVLAESPDLLSKVLSLYPAATGLSLRSGGVFHIPAEEPPFDLAILAANSPSPPFLSAAANVLAASPRTPRLLLGDGWPSPCPELADAAPARPIPASAPDLESLIRQLSAGSPAIPDPQVQQKVALEIAALAPGFLTGVKEAIPSIRESLAQGDLGAVARFAHRLKGSGSSYGYPGLTLLAAKLEVATKSDDAAPVEALLHELETELSAASAPAEPI